MDAVEFLAMGGYGSYVSYIVAPLAIATELVTVRPRLGAARRTQMEGEVCR